MAKENSYLYTQENILECIEYLKGLPVRRKESWFDLCRVRDNRLMIRDVAGWKEVIPSEDRDKVIKHYYEDLTTTGGQDKLYRQIHEKYVGISRQDVMNFLKQQESWQLWAKVVKNKVSYPIVAKHPNHIWQMDLIVFENTPDQGYKYILTIIDLFSKFLRAYPLKNKEAETIEAQLRSVFSTIKPRILQNDNGSEFTNNLVVNLMKEKGIRQAFSKAYTPQSQEQIERVNQTIKGLLYRNFIQTGRKKWVNALPLVVENLNQSIHSTTGFKPKVLNDPQLPEETLHLVLSRINKFANKETKRAPTFNIGDQVRISQYAFPDNKKKPSSNL